MRKFLVFLLVFVAVVFSLFSEEGMFLPQRITPALYQRMKSMGLKLTPEDIWKQGGPSLSQAVVNLMGGTGSFVSPNGLIVTNHHVAFGAVQRQSAKRGIDLIRKGFLAKSMKEEIPAPGYKALVLLKMEDVTKDVLKGVMKIKDPYKRYMRLEKNRKKIIKKREKPGYRCVIRSFYGGEKYYLFTYLELKDIRIVYVPPSSIGNYGGEIDNWMWPRHTGDFSFLRAYVGPDGKPAEYSPKNVPYHPMVYLKISARNINPGDFMFILGYPGATQRYMPSFYAEFMEKEYYPQRIKFLEGWIKILEEGSKRSKLAELKNAGILKGLNNAIKNWRGQLEGFKRLKVVEKKRKLEEKILKAMEASPSLKANYSDVFPRYKEFFKEWRALTMKSFYSGWFPYGSRLLSSALEIVYWTRERMKKDIDRKPGYMDRDRENHIVRLKMVDMAYEPWTDRQVLKYFLIQQGKVPREYRLKAVERLLHGDFSEKNIEAFLDELYNKTKLGDLKTRLALFNSPYSKIVKCQDPFIKFALELLPELDAMERQGKVLSGKSLEFLPKYYALWREVFGGEFMYPDANGTLRLTYGTVKGYSPRDAVFYLPQTTLRGVMEKETGKEPFIVPEKLKKLWHSKDFGPYEDPELKDIPVDFLTTHDTTGGNSGSPVLNGRGELVGLLFDGNLESVVSDYYFWPPITRSISVDARYVLFITDKFQGAKRILKELEIVK